MRKIAIVCLGLLLSIPCFAQIRRPNCGSFLGGIDAALAGVNRPGIFVRQYFRTNPQGDITNVASLRYKFQHPQSMSGHSLTLAIDGLPNNKVHALVEVIRSDVEKWGIRAQISYATEDGKETFRGSSAPRLNSITTNTRHLMNAEEARSLFAAFDAILTSRLKDIQVRDMLVDIPTIKPDLQF